MERRSAAHERCTGSVRGGWRGRGTLGAGLGHAARARAPHGPSHAMRGVALPTPSPQRVGQLQLQFQKGLGRERKKMTPTPPPAPVSRLSLVLTAVAALVSAFMHDFTEGVLLLTIGASMGLSAVMLGRWAKKVRGRSERRVHSRVPASDPVVREAVTLLRELLDSAHVDESHGISHVLAVLGHLDRAVASAAKPIGVARVQALRLAALLHDADDKKYFDSSKTCENAARILRDAGADPNVAGECVPMPYLTPSDTPSLTRRSGCPD